MATRNRLTQWPLLAALTTLLGLVGAQAGNAQTTNASVQGSIVDGISELHQKITFEKGRTVQSNFNDMPLAEAESSMRLFGDKVLPRVPRI